MRANKITLYKVREETIKLLGKADLYFFSPEHPPLTEDAQRALDSAVDLNLKAGSSSFLTQLVSVNFVSLDRRLSVNKLFLFMHMDTSIIR